MTSEPLPSSGAKVAAIPAAQESLVEPVPQVSAASEQKVVREIIAVKQSGRLWLIVLLLGLLFDFLFWEQPIGVNFALFLALSLIGGFSFLLWEGYQPSWKSLALLLPFAFFVAITFLRHEPVTLFLAYACTFFSLGLLATSYLGGRWHLYRLSDYFTKFFVLIGDLMMRPFGFFRQTQKSALEAGNKQKLPIAGILRGLLIALPFVLCFGALLASAEHIKKNPLSIRSC